MKNLDPVLGKGLHMNSWFSKSDKLILTAAIVLGIIALGYSPLSQFMEGLLPWAERNVGHKNHTPTPITLHNVKIITPKLMRKKTEFDLNKASKKELQRLNGIGPVLAQRIVRFREKHGKFSAVEALTEVNGIGPSKLEQISEKLYIHPPGGG